MMLSIRDIEVIENLGFKKEDFSFKNEDGFYLLRNIGGECFFLTKNKCQIYTHRPQGCGFYPIIFDLESNKALLDEECPLIHTISEKTLQSFSGDLQKFVKKLLSEAEID